MTYCQECEDRLVRAATDDPSQMPEETELHPSCAQALARYAQAALRSGAPDRLPRPVRVVLAHMVVLGGLESQR